ncbi:MAG: TIGR04282 family arsenosugar biosynthesis glycosyltransferase [Gammaproteobacteria bacterium]|nr:TIGR04282 family arsenosugar biosynthesis glycosyltransferase [Pseudomonadales bacterium]MCP5345948.1 TIGR04282 family arsenosugar biosynthesis glycosyltransferase [Pseudomonadales bacterium]
MIRYPEFRILLFAREPVAGQVKTRLHGAIGPTRAYQLYCAMLRYQVDKLATSDLAPWEIWVSGNPHNAQLQALNLGVPVFCQQGGDLGARMQFAAQTALQNAEGVVLLGTDCPSVEVEYLAAALGRLRSGDQVVIGPAEDGGYVLLGLRECREELFNRMPWGTDQVMAATLKRLETQDLQVSLLPERWDVDRAEDLSRLAGLQPPLDFQLDEGS